MKYEAYKALLFYFKIFATGAAILALFSKYGISHFQNKNEWGVRFGQISCLVFGVIAAILGIFIWQFQSKLNQPFAGVLIPNSKTSFVDNKILPAMQIADNGLIFRWENVRIQDLDLTRPRLEMSTRDVFLSYLKKASLNIFLEKGALKVSVPIKDRNGKLVAEIINNEWKVSKISAWDRNFNQDSLEVKDSKGEIVFQIRVKENVVQLQCILYYGNGEILTIGKGVDPTDGKEKPMMGLDLTDPSQSRVKIKPIFRYPSNLHLRELVDPG